MPLEDFEVDDDEKNEEDEHNEDDEKNEEDEEKDDDENVDDEEEKEEDEEGKEKKDEEDKEKEKKEDDDEKDKDKKLGLRTRYKDVKEAFPELFKKFPDLKASFFREREFTKLFPTVEDANEAQKKADFYDSIEPELMQGKANALLTKLAEFDQRLVVAFADNILEEIHEFSPQLFYRVSNPLIESFIRSAANDAREKQNKNLFLAARYMAHFLTGKDEIPASRKSNDPAIAKEREELDNQRNQFMDERRQAFAERLTEATMPEVEEIIKDEVTLEDVDNDEYKYEKLQEDIFKAVDKQITNDPRHRNYVNSLWRRAKTSGYQDREVINRLRKAYIDKVRLLVPSVKARLLKEANVKPKKKSEERELHGNRRSSGGGKKNSLADVDTRKIDYSKMTDADIFAAAKGGKDLILKK